MSIDLEDLLVGDGFYDAMGYSIPQLIRIFLALIYLLSVCRCWRFVLDLVVAKVSLTFAWYTCYFHGVWRWFFMVCEDGFLFSYGGISSWLRIMVIWFLLRSS